MSNQQRLWQQHRLGCCELRLYPFSRVCYSLPASSSAAAAMSRTTTRITVEPSEIGTGAVFPEQYEDQLASKLGRVKELFSGLTLPPVEVYRSEPAHFRSRAEFR
jgi:tRNA/tmRNA/rRNA uracil-C5-methylase (TrmA/RlmC/RlmD family)